MLSLSYSTTVPPLRKEAAAALVGVRSKVNDSLLAMVETRNNVVKPSDRLFRTVSKLVCDAPLKVDPKASAVNMNWIETIRSTLRAKDHIENQILDQIEKF